MAVRKFGPTRGAGTRIEEQEGEKTITPGALGFSGYAGLFEKGPPGELVVVTSKTLALKKFGAIISDGQAPDAMLDYFELANGAGGLCLVRVTDGNEVQAEMTLYSRVAAGLVPMGKVKAKNGGRWGGKAHLAAGEVDTLGTDVTETTLQLPTSMATDYATDALKGGILELVGVPNKQYQIVGNTAAGLVTVASDSTMATDLGVSTEAGFYIALENDGKAVAIRIADGEENPDSEFSMEVFVDGNSVNKYGNLHTDPTHPRYWVNVINNDGGNDEIEAEDLWTGAHTAAVRPANHYGSIASLTETVLTADIHEFSISSPGGGDPTFTLGTTTDADVEQTITITMSAATTGTAVSDKFGALGTVTLGTLFDPHNAAGGATENKWVPPFTVTAGGTALAAADVLTIHYKPFVADELINGVLYPDKVNAKRTTFRIVDNDHKTITVSSGSDLTTVAAPADEFMVVWAEELAGGRDGNADVVDANYLAIWDTSTSPFNNIEGKNLGLVKFGTPGVTSTAVQKAGVAYAEAKNHQYRVEIPSNILTEPDALGYINDTIGRSDYLVCSWPSYGSVPDPDPAASREGRLKQTTLTGMIHGREARIAADFDGYHKAQAGVDATLPKLLKIPTGDRKLDEELLNPAGIGVVRKKQGNFVLWGDRTAHRDPAWKFKHQRELMSYYEHVLQENFDFIVFAINDAASDRTAETALLAFFLPEFTKRAIRGTTFVGGSDPALILKVDAELNTNAVRAAGDKIAEVSLRLADTVERFIIRIGKQGIFEQVAA